MRQLRKLTFPQICLIMFVIVGSFLRFWNFRNTLMFLGDQGRDAMIAERMLTEHHPALIGPTTSTGNMYLGPLYYYFMVPFLALTYPDPIGPAYAVAVISVLTILLIYFVGKELFDQKTALFAAFSFTFSSAAVEFARFSWNPNLAPFMGTLLLWTVYRAVRKNAWYWVFVSLCVAVLIQLHYVALLVVPAVGIVWLGVAWYLWKQPKKPFVFAVAYSWQKFCLATILAVGIFAISLLPQFFFDLRHNEVSFTESFVNFISTSQDPLKKVPLPAKIATTVKEMHGRSLHLLFEMFIGKNRSLNTTLWIGLLVVVVFVLVRKKTPSQQLGITLLLLFYVFAALGLSMYRGSVFNHYILYHYPITFFLYGVVLVALLQKNLGKVFVGACMLGFLAWNLPRMPLRTLGWTMDEVRATSQSILSRVKPGEKYNIVLLSGTGDIEGQSYRYFLNVSDRPTVTEANRGEVSTLFIINEDRVLKKVTDSPIFWIVVFPNKQPTEVYTIPDGPEITVLRK